ncbi:MAG: hypothetical protein ACI3YC_02980, partial [Alloprevotella sp.]
FTNTNKFNPLRPFTGQQYSDPGLVMYFSTLPAPSSSAPCILTILTRRRSTPTPHWEFPVSCFSVFDVGIFTVPTRWYFQYQGLEAEYQGLVREYQGLVAEYQCALFYFSTESVVKSCLGCLQKTLNEADRLNAVEIA